MPMTISLNDELAGRLERQALAQRRSVEDWVQIILGHAVENPDELPAWSKLNQRRFWLLEKKYAEGLDPAEEREFSELQEKVAQLLEPHDRQKLDLLKPYLDLASQLQDAAHE